MNLKFFAAFLGILFYAQSVFAAPSACSDGVCAKIQGDRYLRQGKPALAVEEYQKVLKETPDFTAAYFNLAIAYYQQGKLPQSRRALAQLLKYDPNDAEARYNLGCLWLYHGEIEKAEKQFRKGRDCCGPGSRFLPLMQNGLELIEDLKKTPQPTQDLIFYVTQHGLAPLA